MIKHILAYYLKGSCVMMFAGIALPAILSADHISDLDGGVYVQYNGSHLSVDRHSAPTITDWNNDGKKDLVVGEFTGYVWLYLNSGTDAAPVFTSRSTIKANGSSIRATAG